MHVYWYICSNVHSGYASSSKGTETAEVEGLWLPNEPKHFVPEHPDDSINNPEVWSCSPFIVPSFLQKERSLWHHIMTSQSSALIFWWGKPLCMCIGTTTVHLQICQCPHQNSQILWKLQTSLSLFQSLFHACDTLPQVFWCALILESNLLTVLKHKHKQEQWTKTCQLIIKTRWVNAWQNDNKIIYITKRLWPQLQAEYCM